MAKNVMGIMTQTDAEAMVEEMLRVVAARRKEARARHKDRPGHGFRQAPRGAPADG